MRTGRCLFCGNDVFAGKPLFTGLFVGAAYMPPAVKWRRENHGQTARKASPSGGKLSPQVTDEGATTGHFPSSGAYRATFPQRGKAFSLRGGVAPPATKRQREKSGLFVGAAYMPPAVKWRRENHGQTARASNARPYKPAGKSLFCAKCTNYPIASCLILQRSFSWICSPFYWTQPGV